MSYYEVFYELALKSITAGIFIACVVALISVVISRGGKSAFRD